MRLFSILGLFPLGLLPLALADGSSMLADLTTVILSNTNITNAKVNMTAGNTTTPPPATTTLLGNITATIFSVKQLLDSNQTAFVNGSSMPMDDIYIPYTDALRSLASALVALGRAWHDEDNAPILAQIQTCGEVINSFGDDMRSTNLISRTGVIRTTRAGYAMQTSQSAWNQPYNYPGIKRRRAFTA